MDKQGLDALSAIDLRTIQETSMDCAGVQESSSKASKSVGPLWNFAPALLR